MNGFVSYEKLSKRKKRALDAAKRTTWGPLNPVTRKPQNPKAYDRAASKKKVQKGVDDLRFGPSSFMTALRSVNIFSPSTSLER